MPSDITEEDVVSFSNDLINDVEFFDSIVRDIAACAAGDRVESITGDQINKAVYTVKLPEGTISNDSKLDIVLEVVYISQDNGVTWTAQG